LLSAAFCVLPFCNNKGEDMTDENRTTLTILDDGFGDEAEVVKPTLQPNPQLVYMTGNLTTTSLEVAVGWHVPADVNPALDELLSARGVKRYIVQHKTGDVREKPYWNLNANEQTCSLIIVAYGIKSSWEMGRHLDDRAGVAYGVGVATDRDGKVKLSEKTGQPKKKPQVQLRAFIHELVGTTSEDGFNEWFQVSLSNYVVDDMLIALGEQFRVIDAYNALMKAKGSQNRAQYWGFSIPMAIGKKKDVGPKDGPKTPIFPMVATIPDLPINERATIGYLNAHRIPLHIQQRLRDSLLDETVVWSIQRSQEIVTEHKPGTTVTEEPVNATAVALPPLPEVSDPLVDEAQVAWIRDTYCGKSENTLTAICNHFQVDSLTQLRVSQYTLLFDQLNNR
jgi:hypothetical protein